MFPLNTRLTRCALLALFIAACFCVSLQVRLSRDLNFTYLHVQLPDKAVSPKTAVIARSTSGSLSTLYPREENPSIYSMQETVLPVQSLLVMTPDSVNLTPDEITVRAGLSWLPPYTALNNIQTTAITDAKAWQEKLPPGVHVAAEFTTTPLAKTHFPHRPQSLNWQGDFWLIAVPALQTLVILLLIHCIRKALNHCRWPQCAQVQNHPLLSYVISLLKLAVAVLILHQLCLLGMDFLYVRDGFQFALSLILIAATVLTGRQWLHWVSHPANQQTRFTHATTTLICICTLKLIWIINVETTQIGDYEKYFRYGHAMASDNWQLVRDEDWPTRMLYLQRASVYTNLVSRYIHHSPAALELVNLLLQVLTMILIAWLTARIFNSSVAIITLPLLALYPAFWYSTTLATPQIPGFFWMTVVWAAAEALRTLLKQLIQAGTLTPAATLRWLFMTAITASGTAMLQQQKSFAPFVGLATVATGITVLARWHTRRFPPLKILLRILLLLSITTIITVQTTRLLTATTTQYVLNHLSKTPPVSELEYLSSIDSTTDGSAQTVSNWRFAMLPAVPTVPRLQLNARKLLHEKLGVGLQVFSCAFRKAAALLSSETQDHLNRTFGGNLKCREGSSEASRVPFRTLQVRLSQAMLACLLFFTFLRLFHSKTQHFSSAELFPLSFVLTNYAGTLFFFESGPYYAQILAFPLVWSTAYVISSIQTSPPENTAAPEPSTPPSRFIIHTATLLLAYYILSRYVDSSGWTFLKFQPPTPDTANDGSPTTHASRVHQALLMPTQNQLIKANTTATTTITIQQPFRHSNILAFFLTGDARARNLYFSNEHWDAIPLRYKLSIDQLIVASGTLGELQPATFHQITRQQLNIPPDITNPPVLNLTLTLEATKDINVRQLGFTPAVAVEYPFNPIHRVSQ